MLLLSRFRTLWIAGTPAPTVSTASMSVTVIHAWTVLRVMTRSRTTPVTVHMATQASSVTRMWTGAALSHAWTRHCASRQITCTRVCVDQAGQARCVTWRWCLAVMQRYAKVRNCSVVLLVLLCAFGAVLTVWFLSRCDQEWSVQQWNMWGHRQQPPLSLSGWLRWQLLPGWDQWVWVSTVSEWCYVQGSDWLIFVPLHQGLPGTELWAECGWLPAKSMPEWCHMSWPCEQLQLLLSTRWFV